MYIYGRCDKKVIKSRFIINSNDNFLNVFTGSTTYPQSAIGMHPLESNSRIAFLIGAASVTGVCIVFGIGLLYR